MDQALFMIGLILFAALYIGLSVTLFWTLLIVIVALLIYLAVRYQNVAEHYPYNLSETMTSVMMIGMTWVIFIIVGPKPIPFLSSSFTYNNLPESTFSGIVSAIIIFFFILLIVVAVILPWLEGRGGQGIAGPSGGSEGGNITVGT